MKVYRVEWFADAYPAIGKYCQEYYVNVEHAAKRINDLAALGYDASIETIRVIE